MSYQTPLGLSVEEAIGLFKSGGASAAKIGVRLLADPQLGEAVCELGRLSNVVDNKPAGPPCPRRASTPAQRKQGIGLHKHLPVVRAYIFHRQHPWVVPTAIAGTLLLAGLVGYRYGKGKK